MSATVTTPSPTNAKAVVYAASHNDEMQPKLPFTLAHSLGIKAIEVDVWLVDGVILAGHEKHDLSPDRTLSSMYLDPLADLIDKHGCVFSGAPDEDLLLMIDIKGKGEEEAEELYDALLETLDSFIQKGRLSYYSKGQLHKKAITIIGTGSTPVARVHQAEPRYVFLDAPLLTLEKGYDVDGKHYEYHGSMAPMASGRWTRPTYFLKLTELRRYTEAAHARGIKARWWGVARWPGPLRRYLWGVQLQAGVDWLNADDLEDVASFLRAK